MKVRTTIETLDDSGAVDSVSSYTSTVGPGVLADQRALGESVAIALKGSLGQWSANLPDAWVYESLFESIDKGWSEALAALAKEWQVGDEGIGFDDFMEKRIRGGVVA